MGSSVRLCVAAFFSFSISVQTPAEKVVLKPVADTSLEEYPPTNNFGKALHLRVGGEEGTGRTAHNNALMKFDFSALPSTSKVVAASLRVNIPVGSQVGGGRGQMWVFRTLRDWNEGTKEGESGQPATSNEATWLFPKNPDDPWREPGGKYVEDFSFERSAEAWITGHNLPAYIRFDRPALAKDIQGWLDHPESNFGWFFTSIVSIVEFASREDEPNAPVLTVYTGNPDAPRAFLDTLLVGLGVDPVGEYIDQAQLAVDTLGIREIRLESPYPEGHIFFTLDGSRPTLLSTRYERSFSANPGDVLRAVTYSSDYSLGGVEMTTAFVALPTFALNVSTVGNGLVHLAPVPGTSPTRFSSNTVITLVAAPAAGWSFTGWSGDLNSTETTLNFPLTRDISAQANFVPLAPLLTARRIQENFVLVQFSALPNYDYEVESSGDLRSWAKVQTFTGRTGTVDAIFQLESSAQPKFYRVFSKPKGYIPPY